MPGTLRSAVVIPGLTFGPHTPLLMYAAEAAELRGATVRHVAWIPPEGLLGRPAAVRGAWVIDQVSRIVAGVDPASGPLLIAKSLGTNAAAIASDRSLPAVWLTPVLTSGFVVDALRRATAPFLLGGGTDDKLWDGMLARDLTPYVLEVEAADHGMFVPGRLAQSAAVLGEVATAIEDFLDERVWPAA